MLSLPLYPALTATEAARVAEVVRRTRLVRRAQVADQPRATSTAWASLDPPENAKAA